MVSRENRFQNRLPPKVLSRKKTGKKGEKSSKRRKKPWYRHTPWIISLAACGVFIVLIGGIIGVRQVVILVRGSNTEVTAKEKQIDSSGSSVVDKTASNSNQSTGKGGASETTDEPNLEVLPPKAAKQPGRKLPRMLLVGRGTNMFPELAEAMKVAIGGDIIEIRFSGPLYLEPNKAAWKGKEGTLTIRSGKGFQPVLLRKGTEPGSLLTLSSTGQKRSARAVVRELSFVNLRQVDEVRFGYKYPALSSNCPVQVRRCFFASNQSAIVNHRLSHPEAEFLVQDCYFFGLPGAEHRTVSIGRGRLAVLNNLIVAMRRAIVIGGGIDRTLPPQSKAEFRHNTVVHCNIPYFVYARTNLQSRDNLFCLHSSGFMAGLGSRVNSAEEAQNRMEYQGKNNLYFQTNWTVWQGWYRGRKGFSGWQWLTNNGERNPIFADPKFVNPQLVQTAKNQILPPKAFSLRSDSPAKGAGTDGKDIGCDLSKIPTPPPLVEKLIAQMLQKK